MSVLSAIFSLILCNIVSAQIQQIPAPKLAGGQQFQPWINPGPPYVDTKLIKEAVQERSHHKLPKKQHVRPERRIQNGEYKFFLPGLGLVKDYVPGQISNNRPQRQSVKTR